MGNTSRSTSALGRGSVPAVVERELRGLARRPLFFWLRGLLALALGFQAYELLDRYASAPPAVSAFALTAPMRALPGAAVLQQMTWLLFLVVLLMGLLSANSLNRERRDGTLGLLMLTDLTPREIVRGKLISCGLTCFAVLLGGLPALMIPVLAGGVRGSEAALMGIGLLNTLFVVLAAGLWMSGIFRERRNALAATLGLVVALSFGPEILAFSPFGAGASPAFRIVGIAGWMVAARLPILLSPLFLVWFGITHALGWVFLSLAAAALTRTWQDQPHKQVRELDDLPEDPATARPPVLGWNEADAASAEDTQAPARVSWLTTPRPWDADPVRWRAEQLGSPDGLVWLAVALSFFAQFGTLGSVFSGAASAELWGFLSFFGMAVIVFAGGLMAWTGARFFQTSRRRQDLELLLTTPLGAQGILLGQWRVLRRALLWPIGLLVGLATPAGISLLYDWLSGSRNEPWLLLQPFLIASNLAVEVIALCWAGMWYGLRCRNAITAASATVGVVQLLPLTLAVGLMWLWASLSLRTPSAVHVRETMPPVILALLFFLAKNLGVILWARWRLRHELRLGRRALSVNSV